LRTPDRVVVAVLVPVKVAPLLSVPLPDRVRLLPPSRVALPPTVKAFVSAAVRLDARVPPLSATAPVPRALLATPTVSVPEVSVTAPPKPLLLAPETIRVPPPAFSVSAPGLPPLWL